jgi:hypothetical protein
MDIKKNWLEMLLAAAAAIGLVGWGLAQVLPVLAGHWLLVDILASVALIGGSAPKWVPLGWRIYTAISDRMDIERMREQHYGMLIDSRAQMRQGFDMEYHNPQLGFQVKVHNPYTKMARVQVKEESHPQIEGPKEVIPKVVTYGSIADQVPSDRSLLGIYPETGSLEIVEPERYKTAWFVGSSNTGKTNTVYGKVSDMVRWGAKIIICDNHAYKEDSLANKLKDFHSRLLVPIAQTDEDIKNTILFFLREFKRRRDQGKPCTEKWLLVADEVNATANHVVRISKEEAAALLEEFGMRIEGEFVKLQVFFKLLAETCGYEARGFEMFGYFISQKVAGLHWLRNAMMTVFVHGLLMDSEAVLAANNNRKLAELVKSFKQGRTLVYGLDFDPVILQQPKYEIGQVVESTVETPSSRESSMTFKQASDDRYAEAAPEADTMPSEEEIYPTTFELKKILAEIGKMKQNGLSNDAILKQYGLNPGGRNNQNLKAVAEVISELETEEA